MQRERLRDGGRLPVRLPDRAERGDRPAVAGGQRSITGRVNPNGTVTIWATISTASGGGGQSADPNKLVEITDPLNAVRPATG